MTCSLLDPLLGGVTAGGLIRTSAPYVDCKRTTRQQQRLKPSSGGCFHVKCSLPGSGGKYFHHLSFHCCVLFTLFCLNRVGWEPSAFVCLFLLRFGDGSAAIEVMTWALHLGNHFHIQPKRAVMIAFDNQQSKRHCPPRVLLLCVGGGGMGEGDAEWRLRGEMEGVICGRRKRDNARERRGWKDKEFGCPQMQQAIGPRGCRVDPFRNWWCVRKAAMKRLCSHIASYTHSKVRDKCPRARDTHRHTVHTPRRRG